MSFTIETLWHIFMAADHFCCENNTGLKSQSSSRWILLWKPKRGWHHVDVRWSSGFFSVSEQNNEVQWIWKENYMCITCLCTIRTVCCVLVKGEIVNTFKMHFTLPSVQCECCIFYHTENMIYVKRVYLT